jgi:hypothetical protein
MKDGIKLQYTKGIGLQRLKAFHQDTVIFIHDDIESFIHYSKTVQTKEKIGISVFTYRALMKLESVFGEFIAEFLCGEIWNRDLTVRQDIIKNHLIATRFVVEFENGEKIITSVDLPENVGDWNKDVDAFLEIKQQQNVKFVKEVL